MRKTNAPNGSYPESGSRSASGFLWGAATAAHQVEGGNVNNDWWEREHAPGGGCAEPSSDACDSYHRYSQDIDIVADLGLNAYRFSLEWSRIEPEPGEYSVAALDHYRQMVEACHARGVEPVVTLHHFTVPRWFDRAGGWRASDALDRFERFCERALAVVGDGVRWVCTINEPNLLAVLTPVHEGTATLRAFPPTPDTQIADVLLAAHTRARVVLRSVGGLHIGFTVAAFNLQLEPDAGEAGERLVEAVQDRFFTAAAADDFVGIQAYSRIRVGPDGPLPPAESAAQTLTGWEYYPDALGEMVRRAWLCTGGTPILVTENGIATADDAERIRYTEAALDGLGKAIADGVDVRGYLHWSLLDNFEWHSGYRPTFGLVEVDRRTFARTPKPSARWLGQRAKASRW